MQLQVLEKACRAAGLIPEDRGKLGRYELFLADGRSVKPEKDFRKFGIEKGDYPLGAYVVMWALAKDGDVWIAQPIFFEGLHDGSKPAAERKEMRLNRAIKTAEMFVRIENRQRRENGRRSEIN